MPGPVTIPNPFAPGVPLSAQQLNALQEAILQRLQDHGHTGGENGPALATVAYSDKSVTEPKIADGAVSLRTLAAGAVSGSALAAGAVGPDALADGAVKTRHIADAAVTEEKLSAAVRLLLHRTGDSVSSASQVIWRDPIVVFPSEPDEPTIVDWWLNPDLTGELPEIIGLDPNHDPIILNPQVLIGNDGKPIVQVWEVFGEDRPLVKERPELAKTMDGAILDASTEISLTGGFQATGDLGVVTMTGGGLAGGGRILGGTTFGGAGGNVLVGGIQGTLGGRTGTFGGGGFAGGNFGPGMMRAAPPLPEADSVSPRPEAAAPEAAPAAAPATMAARAPATGAAPLTVTLTESGKETAARMTTVGYVDSDGKSASAGDEGAFLVTAGFGGSSTFSEDGNTIDYRSLGNAAERREAATAVQRTLLNLGIDRSYVDAVGKNLTSEQRNDLIALIDGDPNALVVTNVFWATWLVDVMVMPGLLGTGFAISGGRNIASVTLRTHGTGSNKAEFVRVKFTTPYRNAAYSVSATPRMKTGFDLISAHVRHKTTEFCDILFRGLKDGGAVEDVNRISFDLAVFGQLETGS